MVYKYIRVEFVERIRDDINFTTFDEMAEQVKKDCVVAKGILNGG